MPRTRITPDPESPLHPWHLAHTPSLPLHELSCICKSKSKLYKFSDQSQADKRNKGDRAVEVMVHSRAGQQTVYVSEEEAVVHERRNERTADGRKDRAPYPILAIYQIVQKFSR